MAIETKELYKLLDLPESVDTIEKAKEHFDNTFIAKKLAPENDEIRSSIMGELGGKIMTKAAQVFGLSKGEVKDKKIEEILEFGVSKLTGKIKELEDASKNTNDETVRKLTGEVEKLRLDYGTTKEMLQKKEDEFTTYKSGVATEKKNYKINSKIEESKKKLSFKDGITPFEQKGFDTTIKEYQFDMDEKEETIIIRGADGKQVPNVANSGAIKLDELLEKIANDGNLLKKNNSKDKPAFNFSLNKNNKPTNGNGQDTPGRKIAATAIKLGS